MTIKVYEVIQALRFLPELRVSLVLLSIMGVSLRFLFSKMGRQSPEESKNYRKSTCTRIDKIVHSCSEFHLYNDIFFFKIIINKIPAKCFALPINFVFNHIKLLQRMKYN